MNWRHNVTTDETLDFLRDQAVRANAGPLVIDALDELRELTDLPATLEKRDEELSKAEDTIDDLKEELTTLVEHMTTACEILESIHEKPAEAAEFFNFDDLRNLQRYLSFAEKALERHNDKKA